MKIKEILEYGKNNLIKKEDGYRLSKIILKHLLKENDSYLIVNREEEISMGVEEKFLKSIELLNSGMPIQYITNHQEFMKLDFYVDSNVLIPQPDTEIVVEEVINMVKNKCRERSIRRLQKIPNFRFMYRKWSDRCINCKVFRKYRSNNVGYIRKSIKYSQEKCFK